MLQLFFRYIFLLTAVFCTACTRLEIQDHAAQVNEGVGNTTSQLLLLNAVRASKNYPLQFTYVNNYQGSGRVSGGFTSSFPFGSGVLNPIYNINPSLSWNTGVSQMNVTDINSTKAIAFFKKQLRGVDFRYYYIHAETRNLSLVSQLLIDTVRIDPSLYRFLATEARKLCQQGNFRYATNSDAFGRQCEFIDEFFKTCPDGGPLKVTSHGTRALLDFSASYTGNFCRDRQLRVTSYILQTVGFNIHGDESEVAKNGQKPKADNKPTDSSSGDKKGATEGKSETPDPPVGSANGLIDFTKPDVQLRVKQLSPKGKDSPIDIIFRSPESLVRFLGELIAVQSYGSNPVIPTIYDLKCGREVPLFSVHRGRPAPRGSAVAVRDSEGEDFYIPIPDRNDPCGDRTLETLSIVADVISSATGQADIPPVPNFSVRIAPQ